MAKVFIEETTLTAIGDAIRDKEGTTELIPVPDMATRISAIQSGSGGGGGGESDDSQGYVLLKEVVDRSVTELTAEDLKGLEVVGREAFYHCENLTRLELPDTVHTIKEYGMAYTGLSGLFIFPKGLRKLEGHTITQTNTATEKITKVRLTSNTVVAATDSVFVDQTSNIQVTEIQVPGHLLDEYKKVAPWLARYSSVMCPYTKYVSPLSTKIMLINQTKTISIELLNYDEAPTDFEVISNTGITTISDIAATNSSITFKVNTGAIIGVETITVKVPGDDGHVFIRELPIAICEVVEESSYTVEAVEGAQYGFALNERGDYYISQNKGIGGSYALCRIDVHNPMNRIMYVDCINWAEANYDYGILSNIGQTLVLSDSPDDVTGTAGVVVHTSFKGKSTASVQTVVYTDAYGDCSFYIKFRKDGSGDQNLDSLQFIIRFAEVEL